MLIITLHDLPETGVPYTLFEYGSLTGNYEGVIIETSFTDCEVDVRDLDIGSGTPLHLHLQGAFDQVTVIFETGVSCQSEGLLLALTPFAFGLQ